MMLFKCSMSTRRIWARTTGVVNQPNQYAGITGRTWFKKVLGEQRVDDVGGGVRIGTGL